MKLEDLEDSINTQRDLGRDMAQVLAHADPGRLYIVQINSVIRELEAFEAAINSSLRETVARWRTATLAAALVLLFVAASTCLIVYRLLLLEAAARQHLHEQMTHDAFHDPLTQLPNRRYFLEELERIIQRARRHNRVVALLFVDLDGFKKVNDTLGHDVGDKVLRQASERFLGVVRESDFLARLGGDEFAVVMEADNRSNAKVLGERLVASLREPSPGATTVEAAVSASIGVAVYPDDAPDSAALLSRADEAMYIAKRHGRGQVASWGPVPCAKTVAVEAAIPA